MDPFQRRSWTEGWLKLKSSLERPSDKWQKTHIIAKSEYFREASIRKKQKKDWSFASQGGGGGYPPNQTISFLYPATIFIASRCIYQSKVNSDFLAGSLRVNIVHGGGGEGKKDLYLVIQLLDM